jgi:hypothetical protein
MLSGRNNRARRRNQAQVTPQVFPTSIRIAQDKQLVRRGFFLTMKARRTEISRFDCPGDRQPRQLTSKEKPPAPNDTEGGEETKLRGLFRPNPLRRASKIVGTEGLERSEEMPSQPTQFRPAPSERRPGTPRMVS